MLRVVMVARITDYAFDGRTHVVAVEGELDLHSEPLLAERVYDVVDQGKRSIVLDLSKVDFVDSSGIASLLDMLRSLHAADGSMALVIRDRAIARIFRVTGLHTTFRIHHSVEVAVAALEDAATERPSERGA